jgi:hypothetical protein
MRYKLEETHPLSFSKEWPNNSILGNLSNKTSRESLGSKTSNTTNRTYSLKWIPMDTEDNFNQLKEDGFPNRFDADSFNYEVNVHGFRCDDFNTLDFTKQSIVYLGCSHTFGIGSPEEDIWCSILHKLLQEHYNTEFNYVNLGVGGGCIDDYLRFMPYIKKFNPHMIVSCTPPMHRMILPYDADTHGYDTYKGLWSEKNKSINAYHQLLKYNDEYFIYKYDMTLQVVKSITDAMNIEFYEANIRDTFFDLKELITKLGDKAHNRDGCHFARELHEIFATSYFKKITEE